MCASGGAGAMEGQELNYRRQRVGVSRAAVLFCISLVDCVWAFFWLFSVLTRDEQQDTRRDSCCWWQSLCVPGALFFLLVPCVCLRELLLLGVTAAGMMVPLTVDG
ncbi:trans-sialidase [Trypanosoma cruzi]|nr:trans-sialidase [Trypanosoma cruzi]